MNIAPFKRPSAFLPVIMSLLALALLLAHVARYGVVRGADEGAAAHIFQLLMVAQLPIVLFFAFKWIPRAPRQAAPVLAVQAAAFAMACAAVFWLT
jgi:FtsH-binding integral membrane protein